MYYDGSPSPVRNEGCHASDRPAGARYAYDQRQAMQQDLQKRKACWGFLTGSRAPSEGVSTREVGMLSLKLERGLQC
jgi:hypothetical protein